MSSINVRELEQARKKLLDIGKQFPKRKRQNLLKRAAKPLVSAAKSNTPISPRIGRRYKTAKLSGKRKAPKGKGRVIRETKPGTARNSINARALRKSEDIIVGPTSGKNKRYDAWFFHFIEFGVVNVDGSVRPPLAPMRKAVSATGGIVAKNIVVESKKIIDDYVKKNGIK